MGLKAYENEQFLRELRPFLCVKDEEKRKEVPPNYCLSKDNKMFNSRTFSSYHSHPNCGCSTILNSVNCNAMSTAFHFFKSIM